MLVAKFELKNSRSNWQKNTTVNFNSKPVLSLLISQKNVPPKIISSHSAYKNKTDYIIKSNFPWVPRATEFFLIKRK